MPAPVGVAGCYLRLGSGLPDYTSSYEDSRAVPLPAASESPTADAAAVPMREGAAGADAAWWPRPPALVRSLSPATTAPVAGETTDSEPGATLPVTRPRRPETGRPASARQPQKGQPVISMREGPGPVAGPPAGTPA